MWARVWAVLQNTPYGTPSGKIKVNGVQDVDLAKQNLVGFVPQVGAHQGAHTLPTGVRPRPSKSLA